MEDRQRPRLPSAVHRQPARRRTGADRRDTAIELAITALNFIAADHQELSRFLALSGIAPGAIRAAAAEPGFLGGVLAHIASNERTLLAFAAHAGIVPDEVEKARIALAGADWEREMP
jgi:CO/xanthine dehydrogenase FAD-binding subunit